ncbi:MAG: DMT family transporter [Candidatus Bathyarchaeota archaeon]
MLPRKKLGFILVFMAGICWGSAGVLSKLVMSIGFPPEVVAMYRILLGFILLFLIFLIFKFSLLKVKKHQLILLALGGTVGVALGTTAYFYAVKLVSASIAVILLYTYPVFVLIFSKKFLGEKIIQLKVLAAVLVFIGCFLTVRGYDLSTTQLNFAGILMGLVSSFSFTFYTILSRFMLNSTSEENITLYTLGFGGMILLIINILTGKTPIILDAEFWFLTLLLAIIPTVLAFTFFIFGLKNVEASKAGVYTTSEVISALTLAYIVLGERLELLQLIGALTVFFSILVIYYSK